MLGGLGLDVHAHEVATDRPAVAVTAGPLSRIVTLESRHRSAGGTRPSELAGRRHGRGATRGNCDGTASLGLGDPGGSSLAPRPGTCESPGAPRWPAQRLQRSWRADPCRCPRHASDRARPGDDDPKRLPGRPSRPVRQSVPGAGGGNAVLVASVTRRRLRAGAGGAGRESPIFGLGGNAGESASLSLGLASSTLRAPFAASGAPASAVACLRCSRRAAGRRIRHRGDPFSRSRRKAAPVAPVEQHD